MFLQISFTYTRNSGRQKKQPCGTPEVILTSFDSCPLILTLCIRPTRNSLTQKTTPVSTPEDASFISSRAWGRKSKALEKSIIMTFISTPSSKEFAMFWHTVMSWLSLENPGLNPCCPSYDQLFLTQACIKYPAITCSSCLQTTEFKLMGLQFMTADLSVASMGQTISIYFQINQPTSCINLSALLPVV